MNNYKELKVWQKSMDLVENIYRLSASLPENEKYGLMSQIQRSAVSIPSNISEGAGRNSNKEFKNFLSFAYGSSNELNTQLIISRRIGYLQNQELDLAFKQIEEIQKMLFSLINKFSNL